MNIASLGLKKEKKHRAPKSGAKADKKKEHKKNKLGLSKERHNPRAFSVSNIGRTQRNLQRNLDRSQQKEVVPLINRAEELPPPTMVAVMGPGGVGKSTLIRSLVKLFTNQNLSDTKGPITCITGRKRRVTFFECPLDIYSLTDMSKVADLVVLMIDASYGFEMETFEFLNMLQLHGFPKVVGVLTHLDSFKANKTLQSTKKALKHRFWTEIYKGAKMFDLSGVVNGKYLKHEVKRLSLYLMRVKYRPLVWRNTHPFVVVDRVDDITPVSRSNEDPNCDRDVTLYGYVRGTHLKDSMRMHLIGAGDFNMQSITALPDPCPLPRSGEAQGKASLKKKENLLYAPMANVGRVQITEKDGVYIDLKSINYTKKEHLQLGEHADSFPGYDGSNSSAPSALLRSMQDVDKGVDVLMNDAELSLFKGSRAVKSSDVMNRRSGSDADTEEESNEMDAPEDEGEYSGDEGEEEDDEDDELDEEHDLDEDDDMNGEFQGDDEYDNEMEEEGDQDDHVEDSTSRRSGNGDESWRTDMKSKALDAYRKRLADSGSDLASRVYGKNWFKSNSASNGSNGFGMDDIDEEEDDDNDELFVPKSSSSKQKKYEEYNALDSNRFGVASGGSQVSERLLLWKEAFQGLSGQFSQLSFDKKQSSLPAAHRLNTCNETLRESLLDIKNRFVTGDWGGATKPGVDKKAQSKKKRAAAAADSDEGDEDDDNDAPLEGLDDEEVFGDFEDLQTGEVFGNGARPKPKSKKVAHSVRAATAESDDEDDEDMDDESDSEADDGGMSFEDDDEDEEGAEGDEEDIGDINGESDDDGDDDDGEYDEDEDEDGDDEADEQESMDSEEENDEIDRRLRAAAAEKKAAFKANFDSSYDNRELGDEDEDEGGSKKKKRAPGQTEEEYEEEKLMDIAKKLQEDRRERNKAEFGEEGELHRLRHEGCRQGLYVRIVLTRVPAEFAQNFNPTLPVILGGLQPFETDLGYVTARVKRHRWHKGVLKSSDPLIFSIGWRRFQSIPVFSMEDQNQRERHLKYTPQHMHCMCSFYGPIVPPNSGVLAYQKSGSNLAGFRISLTGTTMELKATPAVVKKLKLVGTPKKIYKNTAFITGMFNSALEVAKFEGAKLKTVSGIRGQIKKAVREGEAGTFRATFEDKILMSDIVTCRMWVPVVIRKFYNPVMSLLESNGPEGWTGMRTTAELRKANKVPIPVNKDSLYKPIERTARVFKQVSIPKKIEEALPFASKPKQQRAKRADSYMQKRAVVLDPADRKKRALVSMLTTIGKEKSAMRSQTKAIKSKANLAKKAKEKEKFEDVTKAQKKRKHAMEGKERAVREGKTKIRRGGKGGRGQDDDF